MAYAIEKELGVLVWSNNMSTNAKSIAQEVLNHIIGPSQKEETKDGQLEKELATQSMSVERRNHKNYLGYYFDGNEYHTKRIYVENDTLCLHDVDYDSHYQLEPTKNNRYKIVGNNSTFRIEFSEGTKGKFLRIYRNDLLSETYIGFKPKQYSASELSDFEGFFYCPLLKVGYDIQSSNGSLKATHHRAGAINFRPTVGNTFVSNEWFFSSIDFVLDKNEVKGFFVNTPEIKKLYFEKYK